MAGRTSFFGRLGREPELKRTKDDNPVCTASVAVDSGKKQTEWYRIRVWGVQGEWLAEAKKGDLVVCQGMEYKVEEWEKDGETKRGHIFQTTFGSVVRAYQTVKRGEYTTQTHGAESDSVRDDDDDLPF